VLVTVGDNADVAQIRLMDDAPDAVNITSQFVTVGANTKLNFFNMTTGAAVSRLQGFITLAGEGSELSIKSRVCAGLAASGRELCLSPAHPASNAEIP